MGDERKYISRLFDEELTFCLESVGAVLIVGPKWRGKSTTAKKRAKTIIDPLKNKGHRHRIQLAKESPPVL